MKLYRHTDRVHRALAAAGLDRGADLTVDALTPFDQLQAMYGELIEGIASGALRVEVEATYPLERISKALRSLPTRRTAQR